MKKETIWTIEPEIGKTYLVKYQRDSDESPIEEAIMKYTGLIKFDSVSRPLWVSPDISPGPVYRILGFEEVLDDKDIL